MPLDNLTDLLVFIRVADACSFTLAAERLGISRSAAGKCVNRLEERLATRLLQRTTRSVSLTEDGAVFYEYAQRILSQAEEAETALNTRRQTPRGRLRLDLPVSLGRLHILPILREFLAQWPEVDADVSFSDEYSDLVRDGIDVAVRVGGSDDSRLVRRVLAPHRLITCAAPDYLARHGTPAKPEALGEHETLVFSHQGCRRHGAIWSTANCTNSRCAAGCVSTTSRPCGMRPSPGPACASGGVSGRRADCGRHAGAGAGALLSPGAADLRRLSQPTPSLPKVKLFWRRSNGAGRAGRFGKPLSAGDSRPFQGQRSPH